MTTDSAATVGDAVIRRYSALARTALAGDAIADCDPEAFDNGHFGAAAYPDADAPDTALHASLGCGNPVAVADLRPGDTVVDLGSGGGLDVLLSAHRIGPAGIAYGLDASADMLTPARANVSRAGRLGISDVIADADLDLRRREAAEEAVGCTNGTLTLAEYENLLSAARFTAVSIAITSDAGGGLHSSIVKAVKPG